MIQIPAHVPKHTDMLIAFCQRIVADTLPRFVSNQVSDSSRTGNCFNNVAQYQAEHGGHTRYGWCLWETTGLILQAEFHAIWESPTGEWLDITPHSQQLKNQQIMFLPDPQRTYAGTRINNQREALLDDPVVHDYITAQNALFAETQHYMNDQRERLDTDLQRQDAVQQVNDVLKQFKDSHLALERLIKKRFPRNEPCPCGSGLKTKKCCYP
jgi:hypothetical protein